MHSWRIVATIAQMIQIELSKATLIKLMHHLKSVPLLFPNLMEALHRINLYCKFSFRLFLLVYDSRISSYYFSTSYNGGS
jgi:hypothetical protein